MSTLRLRDIQVIRGPNMYATRSDLRFSSIAFVATLSLLVGAVASAGGRHSSAVRPVADTRVVGRVTDFVTGNPVRGAIVRIRGLGKTRTDANGSYRMAGELRRPNELAVVVRAARHWRRNAWVAVASPGSRVRADWNLVPKGRSFDMKLFNRVVRARSGSTRWEKTPRLRVIENRLACVGGTAGEDCPAWQATSSAIDSSLKMFFKDAMARVGPALTGGLMRGTAPLESVSLPAGTMLQPEELALQGFFTLAQSDRLGVVSLFPRATAGEPIDSQVLFLSASITGTARFFQLVAALGLGHVGTYSATLCDELAQKGRPTSLCVGHPLAATALDALHGRLLYSRPVGNRNLDRDPRPQ